jgi:hypothetical protein
MDSFHALDHLILAHQASQAPETFFVRSGLASEVTMARKTSSSKRSSAAKGRAKTEKVMHEYKTGTLKSGGRKRVTSRKQAVAIALSEARKAGARIPKKG